MEKGVILEAIIHVGQVLVVKRDNFSNEALRFENRLVRTSSASSQINQFGMTKSVEDKPVLADRQCPFYSPAETSLQL